MTDLREPLPRGRGALPAEAVRFLQRARILDATARTVARRGYAETSVARISRAAGVSSKTFYEQFPSKQEAVVAAYDAAVDLAARHLGEAFGRSQGDWLAGVRTALATYVGLLACEQDWARFCIIEAPSIGEPILERREAALRPVLERLGEAPVPSPARPVTARAVVEAIDGVLRVRIAGTGIGADLPGLTRDLSYVALTPFLGPERAYELVDESAPAVPAIGEAPPVWRVDELLERLRGDASAAETLAEVIDGASAARDGVVLWRAVLGLHGARGEVPQPVLDRLERLALDGLRTASFFGLPLRRLAEGPPADWAVPTQGLRCLAYVAEHPGVSGEEVRLALGIAHASQVSRLLNALHRDGLLHVQRGLGGANAWHVTSAGRRALGDEQHRRAS